MIKYFALAFAFATLNEANCGKKSQVPPCVLQKIAEIKAQPKWNPPAEVYEYLYEGKLVYLFSSDCCDQYNVVIDDNCNYRCAPSGGISGAGDGKCKDFLATSTQKRLVWKDER